MTSSPSTQAPQARTGLVLSAIVLLGLAGCSLLPGGHDTGAAAAVSPTPSGRVQQAQLVLQQQGTYSGSVDGVLGPATQESLRLYQQAHHLPASGQLDDATSASLNLGTTAAAETPRTLMADGSKMSEADARKLIESQGFTNVGGLYRDDNAVWRGVGTRSGKTGEVAIDANGKVVVN